MGLAAGLICKSQPMAQTLQALADHYDFDLDQPWNKLPEKVRDIILNGTGEEEVQFVDDNNLQKFAWKLKKTTNELFF